MNRITLELHDGEPVFVLRAQDIIAPQVVELWAIMAGSVHVNQPKVNRARNVAAHMRRWQHLNQTKVKTPD